MLETKFNLLCETPSDINEHLVAIKDFASECETIIELGVRVSISTFALMMGKPKSLTSVDILHPDRFGAQGSHRLEENNGWSSERQLIAEQENIHKWLGKWGSLSIIDKYGMITGIINK
jgi:hypothetical protein